MAVASSPPERRNDRFMIKVTTVQSLIVATILVVQSDGFYTTSSRRATIQSKSRVPVRFSERDGIDNLDLPTPSQRVVTKISADLNVSLKFSVLMSFCGGLLGPFLDSYHSLFGVLTYNTPIVFPILGSAGTGPDLLTCVTSFWVPPLFALAGFIIGWLFILFDTITNDATQSQLHPTIPKVLVGISCFTFQYWLSGILFAHGVDRSTILGVMSVLAAGGFYLLDGTISGLITSAATAIGGPLIEVSLISSLPDSLAYHYTDGGETGFFPLWILPVYFLGGPANGNLARLFWNALSENPSDVKSKGYVEERVQIPCSECNGTRAVKCPNCDDGTYMTYGERVVCRACRGKGRVICRACFGEYGEDPSDIKNIRRIMDQIPD